MGIPKSNLGGVTRIPKLFWGLKKQMTAEFQQNSSMILNGSVSKHPHDQLHVQGVRKMMISGMGRNSLRGCVDMACGCDPIIG